MSPTPTFNLSNEIVLLDRISTRHGNVGPGDAVVLQSPENPRKFVIERIMGVEGDILTYLMDPRNSVGSTETLAVPKGHVWVEGDNIESRIKVVHYVTHFAL
ncbi:putative signal peptidase I [Helianthus annuus]|uniref:Signal peptidase I n=1 Tax=Helianthus annuus TaxID=4232 RepID=A0A251V0D6_HELAN|nr:putative signal peptidase I [Helianthus annuus]KAJ0581971.1 putative signal peptidase I [Helianthus annuus]KAJ0590092.1 putative signal peptidase I [Helianthus annuus]KAJ0597954.1 putative signal peptidase I [Helianthus annuus]KAJ0758583.1 putative signal peptidase I [Helianthus annuus]